MAEIKYNCYAVPPDGIKIEKTYTFGKDRNGYFYSDARNKTYLELDELKVLFAPIGKTWDEVLDEKKTVKAKDVTEATVET